MIDKVILNVSYQDKDKVKQLGAKWDVSQKVWYIPPGLDIIKFDSWLPKDNRDNKILINNIGLARTIIPCWSCKGYCTVYAIYCRELTEYAYIAKTKKKSNNKSNNKSNVKSAEYAEQKLTGFYFLINISKLPNSVLEFITLRCKNFRLGKVSIEGSRLYRNHCDHCNIGLSDSRLHKKYNKSKTNNLNLAYGFNPRNSNESNNIEFIDLLFFENIEFYAEFIDYSNNQLLLDNNRQVDYLVDFI